MAIRRKKTEGKTGRISFKTGSFKKDKKRSADSSSVGRRSILKVLAVIACLVAVGGGLVFLNKYVHKAVSAKVNAIELVSPPAWLNQPLKEKICAAAAAVPEVANSMKIPPVWFRPVFKRNSLGW